MGDRSSWDEVWANVARATAWRSRCNRAKVGACIVSEDNVILATGYNGPPAGYVDGEVDPAEWCQREVKSVGSGDYTDCPALHAEANALMFTSRRDRERGRIYVTGHVCFGCAKLVANSGLVEVVVIDPDEKKFRERNADLSYVFLERCGLTVVLH